MQLSEKQVEEIAGRAAEAAVRRVLTDLGVDHDDPLEMQRDMQHLRHWRRSMEAIAHRGLMTAVGIVVFGTLATIWMGLKDMIAAR